MIGLSKLAEFLSELGLASQILVNKQTILNHCFLPAQVVNVKVWDICQNWGIRRACFRVENGY